MHDDDAIARERETAAKNRNKYSGYDRDTAAYAGRSSPAAASSLSAPTGTPAGEAFATVPKRKPGANGAAPAATGAAAVDPVAATEERISKLVVAEEVPAGGDGAPSSGTGGRARKKLSEISVCLCLDLAPTTSCTHNIWHPQLPASTISCTQNINWGDPGANLERFSLAFFAPVLLCVEHRHSITSESNGDPAARDVPRHLGTLQWSEKLWLLAGSVGVCPVCCECVFQIPAAHPWLC